MYSRHSRFHFHHGCYLRDNINIEIRSKPTFMAKQNVTGISTQFYYSIDGWFRHTLSLIHPSQNRTNDILGRSIAPSRGNRPRSLLRADIPIVVVVVVVVGNAKHISITSLIERRGKIQDPHLHHIVDRKKRQDPRSAPPSHRPHI